MISYTYMAAHFDKVLFIQANRGSHSSTGEFKWLDPVNIEDSRDSLDWIAQQPVSNGRAMAFGISYDGYDALASAASKHPALKSVIACSAPANAATDSFTSGKFVESHIFPYITSDRVDATAGDSQLYFDFVNPELSSPARGRMDDLLLGFDSEEWNQTNEAIDNKNHTYWKERQLLDALLDVKIPVAHVAGLVRDQDGRDTLLAFNHINEKSIHRDNHFLVLHKDGHGCGDFMAELPLATQLIGLTDEDGSFDPTFEKRFAVYSKSKEGYELADAWSGLPLQEVTLPLGESLTIQDYSLQTVRDPNLYSQTLVFTFQESLTLNGAPKAKLSLQASVPEVPLHIHFIVLDPLGAPIEGTHGWRTGTITSKVNEVESVELTFPLLNAEVPKGSQFMVEFSTRNPRVFLRKPASRDDMMVSAMEPPTLKILSGDQHESAFLFSIEKGQATRPDSLGEQSAEVIEPGEG
jgi:predicted acyl esterase